LDYLSELHKVPFVIDPSIQRDAPITCSCKGGSLRSGLTAMLTPHELDFRVQEGGIVVEHQQLPPKTPAAQAKAWWRFW
jgi:hypothetical protein